MADQVQRANIQELVGKVANGVSITRMTDYSVGFEGHNLFSKGTMLANVIGFEVVDSLGQYFKIGKLALNDQTQIAEYMPLTGNEIVGIRYKNNANSIDGGEKIVYFRIFTFQLVDNFANMNANPGAKFLLLHLVEFPAYEMFATSAFYKSYPNNTVQISKLVDDVLSGIKFINGYYNLAPAQPTKDTINFWIPNWNLIKTFKYLQEWAVTEKNEPFYVLSIKQDDMSSRTSSMKKQTIHYESIFKYLNGKSKRVFSSVNSDIKNRSSTTPDNSEKKPKTSADDDNNIDPPDVILGKKLQSYDGSSLISGMNGETCLDWDQTGLTYFTTTFESFLKDYSGLGMWSPFQKDSYKTSWGNQWSTVKLETFGENNIAQAKLYFRNLYGKRLMLSANKLTIYTYTNEYRKTGEKVNIVLPSSDKDNAIDLMNSGDWIIWSIKDTISSNNAGVSEIELIRDSYFMIDKDKINNFIPRINTLSSNQRV
jgi:hypothetical protein